MECFGITDIGTRYSNEDSLLIQEWPSQLLAVAIDGCGAAGGVARIFRDRLKHEIEAQSTLATDGIKLEQLKSAVININNYIIDYRKLSYNIGCCVLTACLVNNLSGEIGIVHCGDCRAYLYSNEDLHQITVDDSYVGHLTDARGITESDARVHPMRHLIFKSLGREVLMGDDNYVSVYKRSASSGDCILLATDGIYDALRAYEIRSIMSRSELTIADRANALVTLARENGSTDNASAILIKL